MKKTQKIGLVLSIVGIVAGSWLLGHAWTTLAHSTYEGEAVFNTVEEYTQFKDAVVEPEVQKWEVDALTSDPPILVNYRITTDYGYEFPYGVRTDYRLMNTEAGLGFLAGGLALILFLSCLGIPASLERLP